MNKERVRLFNELRNCRKCEYRTETSPFVFKMNESKKVMLITLVPGFQAVYRPLTSVRFFRLLCLALYGPNRNVTAVVNSVVHEDIYWTHYHKCYFKRTSSYPEDVPNICSKYYLEKEVDLLKPELILIMVPEVSRRLLKQVPEKGKLLESMFKGSPVMSFNYPITGTEREYLELRKKLEEHIPIVNSSAVPEDMLTVSLGTDNTIAKHAEFELEGLRSYWNRLKNMYSFDEEQVHKVDDLWYKTIIIPRWLGYSFITLCYSVIEDQLKSALMFECIDSEITNRQMNELLDGLPLENKELYAKIQQLRVIRNSIVHRNGLFDRRYSADNLFHGIELQLGRLVVHKEGCEQVFKAVEEFIGELIAWFENRLD